MKKPYQNHTILFYLVSFVLIMIGFSFLAVPLYTIFCEVTGYSGAIAQRSDVIQLEQTTSEHITIECESSCEVSLNWEFKPMQKQVFTSIGVPTLLFYEAHNTNIYARTGVAAYNISPQKAAVYFNKIQCFCFEEQRLEASERIEMPVLFYIEPSFLEDVTLQNVKKLVLHYTFFNAD